MALAHFVGAALGGLVLGSAVNVAVARLPRARPLELPVLACPRCRRPERFSAYLPVMGWLMAEGRCHYCRFRRPSQEPVVETANSVLWVLIVLIMGLTPKTLVLGLFVTALLTLSLIDLEHLMLPDWITLPGIVAGVAATAVPGWRVSLRDAALSAAFGYLGMMLLARLAERFYGEEAIGQGDWKMVAMLGAFLGPTKLGIVVVAANVLGAFVGLLLLVMLGREGRQRLPLGTFLGAAGIAVILLFP